MMLIAVIAWRNVWRSKVRSLVIIASIAVGLCAGLFIMAFSWGMYTQQISEVIRSQVSHIQLHHSSYEEDRELQSIINEADVIIAEASNNHEVKAVAGRFIISGMISSPTGAAGVKMTGIDPSAEQLVTTLGTYISEGAYLDTASHNPLMVGEKLAKKLNIRLKSKVVLTFLDIDGNITAGAFRVKGIFRSTNSTFDETNVFAAADDLRAITGTPNAVNEIALLLHNDNALDEEVTRLRSQYPGLRIETWKDLSPELELVIESFNQYMYIFIGIILLALTFGIINTMLMAVLERTREFGVLMAIGMNRTKVFFTIMLETVYLALVGGPFGMLLAYLIITWTGSAGIDISLFSRGLTAYGFSSIVYPAIHASSYFQVALMAVLTAVLSAIYPAVRALRLKPSEAIRKI